MGTPRLSTPVRAGLTVGGAVLVTYGYFNLPLKLFRANEAGLAWLFQTALLTGLAVAMVATTVNALREDSPGHPGAAILLVSWTSMLVFASWYYGLAQQAGEMSGLKTRIDGLYFMVVTMATVGYGDITATGQTARVVVMIQLLYTFAFLAAGLTAMSTRIRRRLTERANQ